MTTRSLAPLPKGFHGDRHLLELVDLLVSRVSTFVETGSNVGSTLGYVARRFPELDCLSCEPDPEAHAVAVGHAAVREGVDVFAETSQEFLDRLSRDHATRLGEPLLAWLDAHGYGFEWPLREEVRFFTERCERGWLLIDDFRVPHDPRFGWDRYGAQECRFEAIADCIAPQVDYRLYYPAYTEHTSPWHPLRGWGLLQFGPSGEALPSLARERPAQCLEGGARLASGAACVGDTDPNVQDAIAAGDLARAVELLEAALSKDASSVVAWNDLGVCRAHRGDAQGAVEALAQALARDPDHPSARANLVDVLQGLHSDGKRTLPVAPGAWGRMVRRDAYTDIRSLVDVERATIVDGGANRGDTVAMLRRLFPDAVIHAFEPIPALAEAIRRRFPHDEALVVHRAALAAENGRLDFCVRANDVTSSVFEPSELKRRYQGAGVDAAQRLEVLALPLAEAVPEPIDVLKLDLQGYELEALSGLGERLSQVRVVFTEVEFVPLYEGQPLFGDLDVAMRRAGFRLFHLYDVWSHPDGQVTSGDALYVNERFYL